MQSNIFKYQPYLDGMRALAIILVLLYHLNRDVFDFGYIGVDVFFVISGYVITQTLIKQFYTNKKIYILEFYIKRLLRLFPTLLTVILVFFFVYILIVPYGDFEYFVTFKSAFTSIFGLGNFYFFSNIGRFNYFDIVESSVPLIHTWSLGVEEQFYLTYPFLIVISLWTLNTFKKKLENLYTIIFFLIIVSFLFFATNHPFWSHFYLPFSRAWEILLGSLFFFIKEKNVLNFKIDKISLIFFLIATSFLIFIFLLLNQKINYKYLVLMSVISTLLIIYFYNDNLFIRKILDNPITVYIGKISYSIYLWHMPIIYFSNLYFDDLIFYTSSILLTVVFSAFTYHFVEPLRRSTVLKNFLFFFTKKVLLFLIIGLSFYIFAYNINPNVKLNHIIFNTEHKMGKYNLTKNTLEGRVSRKWIIDNDSCNENFEKFARVDLLNCIKNKDNNNLFYLTGDSHAQSFVNTLAHSKNVKNLYLGRMDGWYFESGKTSITANNTLENYDFLSKKYTGTKFFAILINYPKNLDKDKFENIIIKLKGSNVIFLLPHSGTPFSSRSCIYYEKFKILDSKFDFEKCSFENKISIRKSNNILFLNKLQTEYNNVYIFNFDKFLCNKKKCNNYLKEKNLILLADSSHLSTEAGIYLSTYFDEWLNLNFGNEF